MEEKRETNIVLVSEIYPDNIVVLPIQNRPLFPGIAVPLNYAGRELVQAIKSVLDRNDRFLGVSFVRQINEEEFYRSEVYRTGTLVRVLKVLEQDDEHINFVAQGVIRFTMIRRIGKEEELRWNVHYHYEEKAILTDELKAYSMAIINSVKDLMKLNPMFVEQLKMSLNQIGMEKPGLMMDVIASMLSTDPHRLQELLETTDLYARAEKLLLILKEEIQLHQLQEKIQKQINERISKQQKEFFLREELKVIKKELGLEKDEKTTEIERIEKRIRKLKLSDEAREVVEEELGKLKMLDPNSPEYHVSRTYLTWITDLPWGIFSKGNLDIKKARHILDRDHYGLTDVKQRILEFISTIIKRGKVSGSIICLVGPPGVGKTSVGKSIADALGRKFYRFSVGGMRDEAEIKGHRRTYIGAMPGKFIQSLKRTGVANPVIMLDEIDKIGASFQGDPAAALLEVLDPEQNKDFLDHYLDVRFDLSNILFITTANQLDTIPQPLLDRMEVIKLPGYILEEKLEIAKRYLIPRERKEHGLKASEIQITGKALRKIIDGYAREAGVRSLEQQIRKIMRKATLMLAENKATRIKVTEENLKDFLGNPVFTTEELYKRRIPGVVLGLAWTAYGGDTLYIEANAVAGKGGGFKQTGQLGKVMQESSEIAYSYVKSILSHHNKHKNFFSTHFIHLHVPAGATPKDGPSAGITMALALHSLATDTPVKEGIAMTGELTLTGKVLPIGGIREKTIAARRVGIRELIIPSANRKDFEELPEYLREGMTIHYADYFEDVLKVAYPDSRKNSKSRT